MEHAQQVHDYSCHTDKLARRGAEVDDRLRRSEKEQIGRVLPVIEQLSATRPARVAISIDTRRVGVAEAALDAGANIVNDASGGNDGPGIIALCTERGCSYIINHMRGRSRPCSLIWGAANYQCNYSLYCLLSSATHRCYHP